MTDQDTVPKYGLTRCQLYGICFRRGIRHAAMGVGYYYRGESGRVDLGDDMLEAYEATAHLPEQSGGRD
jgi:hypothetical protein